MPGIPRMNHHNGQYLEKSMGGSYDSQHSADTLNLEMEIFFSLLSILLIAVAIVKIREHYIAEYEHYEPL